MKHYKGTRLGGKQMYINRGIVVQRNTNESVLANSATPFPS